MRCYENASLVQKGNEEGREHSCNEHSLFMGFITPFRSHFISCFFDLFSNVQSRLICNIFHKQKANITAIVNIDQTADIAGFIGNKPPEDYLTIQFRFSFQDFSACFDDIMRYTWSRLFRDLCEESQKLIHSDCHVIIYESLAWGWPGGYPKSPSDAERLGRRVHKGDNSIKRNCTYKVKRDNWLVLYGVDGQSNVKRELEKVHISFYLLNQNQRIIKNLQQTRQFDPSRHYEPLRPCYSSQIIFCQQSWKVFQYRQAQHYEDLRNPKSKNIDLSHKFRRMTKSKRTSLKRQAVFAVFKQNIFLLMLGMDSLLRWWPKKKIDIFGKNDITHSSIPYYLWSFVMAFAFVVEQINPFLFLAVVYGVVPILDEIFIFDTRNPTSTQRKQLNKSQPYFLAPIYCGMILSWFVHVKAFTIISQIDLTWSNLHYLIALMYILSNVYTVQFVVAHELIHKNTVFNRILGTCYMVSLYYAHFTPHHINTHHKWVATPNDPNTPRKGEPLYDFVVRSMIDSWKGVYNDQKKEGKHFLANYAILSILASSVFAFLIFSIWGTQVAITHSLMALGAIFYLQTISYIEHYGLLRKKLPNGEYEKVTIMHSWNAPQRFTNYLFFKVQRHSDHHQNSSTPYQALCSLEQSPFMPHGYTVMIPLAFFPKVNMVQAQTWFRIMNPLLQAYQAVEQYRTKRADPEAIDTAVAETRKFMVKLTVLSFGLAMASVLDLI